MGTIIDIAAVNERMQAFSEALSQQSLNYRASFRIWESPGMAGERASAIIAEALGPKAVLGGTFIITAQEVIEEVANGFLFPGDPGAHPGYATVQSAAYQASVAALMAELSPWIEGADQIIGFWLRHGHPFWTVYWDYAYIIESGETCLVFIGAASD